LPVLARLKSLLTYSLYLVYHIGSFLAGLVPPAIGYWLAQRGADLAYWFLPLRRRIAAENFARVLRHPPDGKEVRRVVRASFRNFACYLYEVARFPHLTLDQIRSRVIIHWGDHFQKALEKGKGVIFVSAHFGNMDLTAAALAQCIGPLVIPGTALKPRRLMDTLIRHREKKGLKMSVYDGVARDVLMALKQNRAVGFLVDVGMHWKEGVTVDFFGEPAPFPAGPALLALKTGAPIITGYAVVRPDHTIEAFAEPPIFVEPTGNKEADVQACMQKIARVLEGFISRYPEQWYMYRPMWASPYGGHDHQRRPST